MLKIKKALSLGLLITTVIPSAIMLTSCSNSKEEIFNVDISDAVKTHYGNQIAAKLETNPESVQRKTMLITAGAAVNDKSFNQETWGALQVYRKQANITNDDITFRETTLDQDLPKMYDQAMNGGYKTLILTGFQHSEAFSSWLEKSDNKAKFIESKAVVVGVDWNGTFIPKGQFFGLGFKSEEASWVVGRAASQYLVQSGKKQHLSSFGGAEFDGVTDFNNGFLQGMLDWNIANELDATKKVKFYSGDKVSSTINLATGFDPSAGGAIEQVASIIGTNDEAPQIILPVAGGLVAVAIDNIKAKKTEQMLIGTDTNQSIAFPQDKNMFFSSIEKKVAMAVYKTIVMLAGIPLDFVDATISDVNFQGDFVELKTSAYVKYGFDKGFVGYSKSTLAGENSAKADLCLKEAHELFKKLDLNNYFKPMTDPTKNQVILDTIIKGINS